MLTSPDVAVIELVPVTSTAELDSVTATATSIGSKLARLAHPCLDKSVCISAALSMITFWPAVRLELSRRMAERARRASNWNKMPPA